MFLGMPIRGLLGASEGLLGPLGGLLGASWGPPGGLLDACWSHLVGFLESWGAVWRISKNVQETKENWAHPPFERICVTARLRPPKEPPRGPQEAPKRPPKASNEASEALNFGAPKLSTLRMTTPASSL